MNQTEFEAGLKALVEKADASPEREVRCGVSVLFTLLAALTDGSTYNLAALTAAYSVDMIGRLSAALPVAPMPAH